MVRSELLEQWDEFKAAIKRHWEKVTDDDLAKFDATLAGFADTLRERYGMTSDGARREVRGFLARLRDDLRDATAHVRESAHDAWERARDRVGDGAQAARDRFETLCAEQRERLERGRRRVGEFVHERPFGTLAVAAGAGALLALLLRRK